MSCCDYRGKPCLGSRQNKGKLRVVIAGIGGANLGRRSRARANSGPPGVRRQDVYRPATLPAALGRPCVTRGCRPNRISTLAGGSIGRPMPLPGMPRHWHHPRSGDWIRTFVILTVPANELVAEIHDRMPLILPKIAYERWLGTRARSARSARARFPPDLMTMWPVSTRVNKPENDDAIAARSGRVISSPARSVPWYLSQRPPPASFERFLLGAKPALALALIDPGSGVELLKR